MDIKTHLKIKLLSLGLEDFELDTIINSMKDVIELEKDEFKNKVEEKLLNLETDIEHLNDHIHTFRNELDSAIQEDEYSEIVINAKTLHEQIKKLIRNLHI